MFLPTSSYREVLRNPRFLQLWGAQLLAQVSQNAINFALIVLINARTGSTLAGGVLVVLFSLPAIVLGPVPGLVVDRVGRWWVLWPVNLLRVLMGLGAGVGLAFLYDGRGHGSSSAGVVALLYLFSLGFSITTRFFLPAEATAIPRLVGMRGLGHGLALFGVTYVLAQAVGLVVLGPVLHAFFGWPAVFYYSAGGFALATLLTVCLPPRRLGAYQDAQAEASTCAVSLSESGLLDALAVSRQSLWQQMREGWKATVKDRQMLSAVVRLSLAGVIIALVSEVAPNFVAQVLRRPPEDVSLVLAPAGLALMVGAALAPRFARRMGQLPAAGLGVNGVALAVVALALNRPLGDLLHLPDGLITALAMVGASLLGFALNLISIPCQALLQERVLPRLRGQVLAFQQALFNLVAVPVLLLVGALADAVGMIWPLLLLAAGVVVVARWQRQDDEPPSQPRVDTMATTDTLMP